MKNNILFTSIFIIGFTIVFFGTNTLFSQTPKNNMVMKDTTLKYTCPHHSEVISDKPGKCACGMELVVLKGKDKISNKTKKESVFLNSKGMKHDKKMRNDSITMKKGTM